MAVVTNLSINVIEQTSTRLRIKQNTQGYSYIFGGLLFFAGILLDGLLHIRPVLTIAGLVLAGFMWWLVASSIELLADRTGDILELKSAGLVGKAQKRQCQLSSITSIEVEWNQTFKIFGILLTLEHQIPFSITKEFNFSSQVEAEEFCKLLNGFLQVQSN
jgi:hypothetical protein